MTEAANECGLILAAAGSGRRYGTAVPKQFSSLEGKPVYLRALETFFPYVSEIVIVTPQDWTAKVTEEIAQVAAPIRIKVQAGGDHRQQSVQNGLRRLSSDIGWVLVHDAARPFVSQSLVERVLDRARQTGAAIPVLPVHDTVKEVDAERVIGTVDRSRLRLAQTPQGFRRDLLEQAFAEACRQGFMGTDESALVERLGERVRTVEGESSNVKITRRSDLKDRGR